MHNLTLYEISQDYLQALDLFTDPEADIPLEAAMDTLEGLEGQLQEKAVNVAKFMQNLDTTARAIKEAEQQMARRRKAIEKAPASKRPEETPAKEPPPGDTAP